MNKNRKKVQVKTGIQFRAEGNLKEFAEQRAELMEEMEKLTTAAETEQRAFTDEETNKFEELEKKIKQLDATVEKLDQARSIPKDVPKKEEKK